LDPKEQRYGFIGTDDWFMYPLLQPGSFVVIDETRRRIQNDGWTNEFDRPIYFLEHRTGYLCGWCSLNEDTLIMVSHPASAQNPRVFAMLAGVDVIGLVVGVAMCLVLGH